MQNRPSRLWELAWFCFAGLVGTIIFYGSLYGFTERYGLWYVESGMIGITLNTFWYFFIHKFVTFMNKDIKHIIREFCHFFAARMILFAGNAVVLYGVVEFQKIWYVEAQILLSLIFSGIGFIWYRRILRKKSEQISPA